MHAHCTKLSGGTYQLSSHSNDHCVLQHKIRKPSADASNTPCQSTVSLDETNWVCRYHYALVHTGKQETDVQRKPNVTMFQSFTCKANDRRYDAVNDHSGVSEAASDGNVTATTTAVHASNSATYTYLRIPTGTKAEAKLWAKEQTYCVRQDSRWNTSEGKIKVCWPDREIRQQGPAVINDSLYAEHPGTHRSCLASERC